jgi:hypothetical protein
MTIKNIDLDARKSRLLMELAYASIIEDIHQRTERILRYHYGVKNIKKPFVPPLIWGLPILLPQSKFRRGLGHEVWGKRAEHIEKEYKQDVARLADLIPIAEELERWFAAEKENTINENVNAFLGSMKSKKVRKRQ